MRFDGVGGSSLPPWVVRVGETFNYKLPKLIDSEDVDVDLETTGSKSLLTDCDCYGLDKAGQEVELTLPDNWPSAVTSEVLLVYLSHGSESRIYSIPITITFD